jgi:hypothetical protein
VPAYLPELVPELVLGQSGCRDLPSTGTGRVSGQPEGRDWPLRDLERFGTSPSTGTRTGTRSGTSCRTSCGTRTGTCLLIAGLEAVTKGNSRVKIGKRRRVQHLEKFRLFRVPVRPKRRDSVLIIFLVDFFVLWCTLPKPSTTRGGKKKKKIKLKKRKQKLKKHSPLF